MEAQFNSPADVVRANIKGGVYKACLPLGRMILFGFMAGIFIALGGAASSVAAHGVTDTGLARMLAGVVFPVGLIMIVCVGGELFTGNCLMSMAVLDRKVTWAQMGRNLAVVYMSNFAGALLIDVLVFFSGQLDYSGGGLGAYTIKVALGKVNITPAAGITSGILCNILVCLAILMAGAARDIAGKIWAAFFPIFAFVVAGFEHCVANMFYIPAGILAASNPAYAARAQELYGITAEQCGSIGAVGMLRNLVPVTIGNMIGGAVFIGMVFFMLHVKTEKKES